MVKGGEGGGREGGREKAKWEGRVYNDLSKKMAS